jgi:hypothetical protein
MAAKSLALEITPGRDSNSVIIHFIITEESSPSTKGRGQDPNRQRASLYFSRKSSKFLLVAAAPSLMTPLT